MWKVNFLESTLGKKWKDRSGTQVSLLFFFKDSKFIQISIWSSNLFLTCLTNCLCSCQQHVQPSSIQPTKSPDSSTCSFFEAPAACKAVVYPLFFWKQQVVELVWHEKSWKCLSLMRRSSQMARKLLLAATALCLALACENNVQFDQATRQSSDTERVALCKLLSYSSTL